MKKRHTTKKYIKKRQTTKKYKKHTKKHRKTRKLNKKKQRGGCDDDDGNIKKLIENNFQEFKKFKKAFIENSKDKKSDRPALVILTNMLKGIELKNIPKIIEKPDNINYTKYSEYLHKDVKNLDVKYKSGIMAKVCKAEREYNTEYEKLNKVEDESNDDKKKKFIYLILTTIVNYEAIIKNNKELSEEIRLITTNAKKKYNDSDFLYIHEINPYIFSYFFKKNMEKKYDDICGIECTSETDNCKTIFEIDLFDEKNEEEEREEQFGFEEEETVKKPFFSMEYLNMCELSDF